MLTVIVPFQLKKVFKKQVIKMKQMNKIFKHKIALFSLLLLVLLNACKEENKEYAKFTFKENLAVKYNSSATIEILPLADDLKEITLQIGNETVNTWKQIGKEPLKISFDSKKWGIGAKDLVLTAVANDGSTFEDKRIVRVVSDVAPQLIGFDVVATYPHNISNFTQGLEFNGSELFESTGQMGESKIAKVDIATGNDLLKVALDATHFGEGITILRDTVYQLTWTTGKCFLYDKNTLQILPKDFSYKGEGWGICNDGEYLITSDGSERLTFRNPKDFSIVKTIEVYTHEQPVIRLNELEYVSGFIFANIWMTSNVAIIEPQTGRVLGVLNCASLVSQGRGNAGDVLNGIAYSKIDDTYYLTGKYWSKLFKIKLQQKIQELSTNQ